MLVSTNGNADQTYTNTLLHNGTPVTTGAAYSITGKPAGLTDQITVNEATGEVTFGKPALDKVNADGPQRVTVQAAYKGKTASYTFTVTDHFSPRYYHSSVVLGNDIYVIGGTTQGRDASATPPTPEINSNEVWRSSDGGLTWDQVADAAKRFSPARKLHSPVVLGEDIYVIAGRSSTTSRRDVWKSSDRGVSWNRAAANAGFSARYFATVGVLNGALYLMGGFQGIGAYLNDVWRSTDGVTWTEVTNTTAARFVGRLGHASVVLPGSGSGGADELYYIGGFPTAGEAQNVYKSGDGGTWTQLTPVPGFANNRYSHTAVVLGGDIYLIAGQEGSTPKRDVWKSQDKGATWSRITAAAGFGLRTQHSSVVNGGAMYLIGGSRGAPTELHNDVWRSTDGAAWVNVHENP